MIVFLVLNTVLQTLMVVAGHYSEAVINLSAILGVGIPFLIAIGYGALGSRSYKEAAKGAFIFSFVGAAIGVVVAILMGDQPWLLLTFAPLSSGVTGVLGAWIGVVAGGSGSITWRPVPRPGPSTACPRHPCSCGRASVRALPRGACEPALRIRESPPVRGQSDSGTRWRNRATCRASPGFPHRRLSLLFSS